MYPYLRSFSVGACLALASATAAFGASAKSYQVTGAVVAIAPTTITIEKDHENWEIARDSSAKGDADVKVGDRVTIQYRMIATKIEQKPGKSTEGKDADTATAKKKKGA